MVGVCSLDFACVFTGPQRRLLDHRCAGVRLRQYRNGSQSRSHGPVHEMSRHEAEPYAPVCVAHFGNVRPGSDFHQPALRGADYATGRSLFGRPFLRYSGGGLRDSMDAFLLDFRASGSVHPGHPRLCVCLRNHSGIFAQAYFWLSGHGRSHRVHRLREHQRVGSPYVHHRNDLLLQQLFRADDDDYRCSHGHQDLQLARHDVGREASVQDTHVVLHRIPISISDRRLDRHHARRRAFQLAAQRFVLCGRAFPLHDRRRNPVLYFRCNLLLVSQNHRKDAERIPRETPFLAVRNRVSPDVRCDARSRNTRHATAHIHLRARPGLGYLEHDHHDRRIHPGHRNPVVSSESGVFLFWGV